MSVYKVRAAHVLIATWNKPSQETVELRNAMPLNQGSPQLQKACPKCGSLAISGRVENDRVQDWNCGTCGAIFDKPATVAV
jgi:ribosomal protein L37AE/L43A